jgi:hypothetical protein
MSEKELTIKYLTRQMETYLTAKEFAEFKLYRLTFQNEFFGNPNMQKEFSEFTSQKERCATAIDEIVACIAFLKLNKFEPVVHPSKHE